MKTLLFESREAWLEARRGKITGSTSKEIIPTGGPTKEMISTVLDTHGIEHKKTAKKEELEALLPAGTHSELIRLMPKKLGFFKLIAERLALPPEDGENEMERGSQLECEAVERFAKLTGKKFNTNLVMWVSDKDDSIAVSPDAFEEVEDGKPIEEAVEVKCLGSARHIMAWYYKEVPDDYWWQVLQYFIVNDQLKRLNFVMYDPRIPAIELVIITVTREQLQAQVDEYLEYQRTTISEVNEIVNKLTF